MKEKAVTVRDIADALGLSIGTVDRALHDRAEVSAKTRAAVLRVAQQLNYRPNQAARYLATGRKLKIAVSLPREIAAFFDQICLGIEEEAEALTELGVSVSIDRYARMGLGEEASFESAVEGGADGIVVVPGSTPAFRELMGRAVERGIPVICVATDAPATGRTAVVSIDPEASGALAAELMGRFLGHRGKVALVTGALSVADHAAKLNSYARISGQYFPEIELLPAVEAHDTEREAYGKVYRLLQKSAVHGVYVSTINALPVLRALHDLGLLGTIPAITTDLFPELIPHLQNADVAATLYQRPKTQGQVALRMLHRCLVEGEEVTEDVRLAPHVVMRGNLSFFLRPEGSTGEMERAPGTKKTAHRAHANGHLKGGGKR